MTTPNHLRRHRRSWALTQAQVAALLGLRARSVVSSHERGEQPPTLALALGYQAVFGATVAELFPDLREEVEDAVFRRAVELDASCRGRGDPRALRNLQLLQAMTSRAANANDL